MIIRSTHSRTGLLRSSIRSAKSTPRALSGVASLQQSRHSSWWSSLSGSKKEDSPATHSKARSTSPPTQAPEQQDSAMSSAQSSATQTTTQTPPPLRLSKTEMAERDRAIFEALDNREGGGAGNEIVDGQFEKGMTKNTRANQYRVI